MVSSPSKLSTSIIYLLVVFDYTCLIRYKWLTSGSQMFTCWGSGLGFFKCKVACLPNWSSVSYKVSYYSIDSLQNIEKTEK